MDLILFRCLFLWGEPFLVKSSDDVITCKTGCLPNGLVSIVALLLGTSSAVPLVELYTIPHHHLD